MNFFFYLYEGNITKHHFETFIITLPFPDSPTQSNTIKPKI